MVGIIQEQHPDRCRLFMQWKRMDWPILVDSLNLLQVTVVPRTLAVDEYGVVRHGGMRVAQAGKLEEIFLNHDYAPPAGVGVEPPQPALPDLHRLRTEARSGGAAARGRLAEAAIHWGGVDGLSEALTVYDTALAQDPADGWVHFRLGVVYRLRFDSEARREGDFQQAIHHWSRALDLDPNNYIWRRRIQQYGPRLEKPYPFYDWVRKARQEIAARGETPHPLRVEPGEGEFARPSRRFVETPSSVSEPDPSGRIHRDPGRFVRLESTVVPAVLKAGESARVHLDFRPQAEIQAHWNNEVDDLVVWIRPPRGWKSGSRHYTYPNPANPEEQTVSREVRTVEMEIQAPPDARAGTATLSAYALYYVCEDVDGTCLFRRQDTEVEIEVMEKAP